MVSKDIIKLTIPMEAKYISIARLAISGLTYESGLTIDDVEDLKVCIGEACVHVLSNSDKDNIEMEFEVKSDKVHIRVNDVESPSEERDGMNFGLLIIESLMDEVSFNENAIEMVKHFKDDANGNE